jgi:crotonobetainyl-CoA:carnitine CoA-transferase CaiB-like acyl-CoA transferase
MHAAGRPDLAEHQEMQTNAGRVVHQAQIDEAIGQWCLAHSSKEVIAILEAERVPVGPIYNVQDMFEDPHYQARKVFERVEIDGRELDIPALIPKLESTPGKTEWPGAKLGAHTSDVLIELLELDDDKISELRESGVI